MTPRWGRRHEPSWTLLDEPQLWGRPPLPDGWKYVTSPISGTFPCYRVQRGDWWLTAGVTHGGTRVALNAASPRGHHPGREEHDFTDYATAERLLEELYERVTRRVSPPKSRRSAL